MKLSKIKLMNYRCFGEEEQQIPINSLTTYIGNNSTGKTAALSALNCMFSENSADRIISRSDFHLPLNVEPEDFESQNLYIETIFEFDELKSDHKGQYSVPTFFQSLVIGGPNEVPYLRIRLEASWERSNSIDGAIESKINYIVCPEEIEISEDKKIPANRKDLDQIRVLYVPAMRDPSKQLRNVSGSMIYQIMNSINWSDSTKTNIKTKIDELNDQFMLESGVSILDNSIHTQWESYDSDLRYSNAQLRINSTDFESSIKKSEVVFLPTVTGKEYSINEMGDGLKSLFYISLVDSILDVEAKIQEELAHKDQPKSFSRRPPVLTIIALEEPENHIAPQSLGKLVENLNNIAKKCNAQTILTSHSSSIVQRIDPKDLRYFRIESTDCSTRVRSITLPNNEEFPDQYKFIKEAVQSYPELYFAKLVILGEGDSEEILLPKFWESKNNKVDISGISIVPLGGRHVNHFWRLLNDLKIPYITLLDFDEEREGGGWGRIKYVLNQLIELGCDINEMACTEDDVLTPEKLKNMDTRSLDDKKAMKGWLNFLEKKHVFFSAPLDIDFLMLEHYGDVYKSLVTKNEGPRFYNEKNERVMVSDAEKKEITEEYKKRINIGVRSALKECGGNGDTYTEEQKKLLIWYSYFFLQRGKPSTHIEAISKITKDQLDSSVPPVFSRLIEDVKLLLLGGEHENNSGKSMETNR